MIVQATKVIKSPHPFTKSNTPASKSQRGGIVLGLRYERRFLKELKKIVTEHDLLVEHNPWFCYMFDDGSTGHCSPDILIHTDNKVYVIEVKYTYVPEALHKLKDLYCPVVQLAYHKPAIPLVVAKVLTPESPKPRKELLKSSQTPLYQWIETMQIML